MPITRFPDPRQAGPDGLVALGGDLQPETLLLAYRSGIFPWPVEEYPLAWFCPENRGILEFSELHLPRRLAEIRRKSSLRFTADQAFEEVIRSCADRAQTWITPEITEAYTLLHKLGHAHSLEAWNGDRLVGGLYGVAVDGVFAGESMFHLESNASKLALLELVDRLEACGATWMDIQMVTPHMEALGAKELPRREFLDRLARTRKLGIDLSPAFRLH